MPLLVMLSVAVLMLLSTQLSLAAQPAATQASAGTGAAPTALTTAEAEAAAQQSAAASVQPEPEPAVDTAQRLLAQRLPATEVEWLSLPDPDRRTLLWSRPSYAASPRGQVLIVAADGWPARNSPHLQALQRALPEHRWDSAAINPVPPPLPAPPTQSLESPDRAAGKAAEPEPDDGSPVVDDASRADRTSGADRLALPGTPGPMSHADVRHAAVQQAAYATLEAAIATLRQPGDAAPVLVGLEHGAQLALDWILEGGTASALVLVNMPSVPEAAELASLGIPVLDLRTLTDPAAADRQSRRARRAQSLGDGYRTVALPPPVGARSAGEPLLVRRLRGWMEQMLAQPDTGPALGAASSAASAWSSIRKRSGVPTSVQRPR